MEQRVPARATHHLSAVLGLLTLALAAGATSAGFFSWRMKVYTPETCAGCIPSPPHIDPSFWEQALKSPYGLFYFAYCAVLAATCLLYFPRFGGGGKIQTILAGISQIILGIFSALLIYLSSVLANVGDYAPGIITYSPAYTVGIVGMLAFIPLGIFAVGRGIMMQRM